MRLNTIIPDIVVKRIVVGSTAAIFLFGVVMQWGEAQYGWGQMPLAGSILCDFFAFILAGWLSLAVLWAVFKPNWLEKAFRRSVLLFCSILLLSAAFTAIHISRSAHNF